jgi:hypothetical protein
VRQVIESNGVKILTLSARDPAGMVGAGGVKSLQPYAFRPLFRRFFFSAKNKFQLRKISSLENQGA